jgi:hypothetical protein
LNVKLVVHHVTGRLEKVKILSHRLPVLHQSLLDVSHSSRKVQITVSHITVSHITVSHITVSHIRPWALPFTTLSIHFSFIMLLIDIIRSEKYKMLLNKI